MPVPENLLGSFGNKKQLRTIIPDSVSFFTRIDQTSMTPLRLLLPRAKESTVTGRCMRVLLAALMELPGQFSMIERDFADIIFACDIINGGDRRGWR